MKKYRCPFKQHELVAWQGEDPTHTFLPNQRVLFLGEILQMPGHCIVVNQNGKVIYGFHTDNFRKLQEDEL
jgi:hypothetical protein